LSAETWGFEDVLFGGASIELERELGSYVMENVLFKISFPAEFHAQTAVEAAMALHPDVVSRLDDIDEIVIETQEAGVRIIDKTGPLDNPADRDHCLQYMVAVPLVFGRLTADDYEDDVAQDPRIDTLRNKMTVSENAQFSIDYLDPDKRAIGNAVQIRFADGSSTERVAVDYPIGHRRRRAEGIPVLLEKFERNLATQFDGQQLEAILDACRDRDALEVRPVPDFMNLWVKPT
jgi:2-methylcitrate dehydratase